MAATLFTDQRWVDLAPGYFDVSVVRHPGINVAKWNVDERPLRLGPSGWRAGDGQLVMMHYSGVPPTRGVGHLPVYVQRPDARVRHDPVTLANFERLCTQYVEEVARHRRGTPQPYRWGFFADGRSIPKATRRRFRHALIAAESANEPPPQIPTRALPWSRRIDVIEEFRLPEAVRTGFRTDRARLAARRAVRGSWRPLSG
jgi:hypothetical protein